MEQKTLNPLAQKIVLYAADRGDDFRSAAISHLETVYKYLTEKTQKTENEKLEYKISRLFLKKMELYPTERFKSKVNENSGWPVPILPVEMFRPLTRYFRAEMFIKLLKVNDILDCKMKTLTSVDNPYYHLKVIHKFNCTQILEDLDIEVQLNKRETDVLLLGKKLCENDYVRVTVSFVTSHGEIFASLSGKDLQDCKHIGKLSETDLPSYVSSRRDFERFPTYSKYLKSFPQIGDPHSLGHIFKGFGLDNKMPYSFIRKHNEKQADEETGVELLKKIKRNDSEILLQLATNKYYEKNFQEARKFIKMAIEACPKGDNLESKLCQFKRDIYAANLPEYLILAMCEWINSAYNQNAESQKLLSVMFAKISKRYCIKKEYQKAIWYAESALKLHPDNSKATKIIEYVKKKQPEIIPTIDMSTLEERKREIQSKLQKWDREMADDQKRKHSSISRRF